MGYTGNNGTQDTDYLASIASRTAAPPATPGPFRNGATASTAYADFDQSLAPINSFSQGGAAGSYEVHAGDTLATIAAQLWGDSSLWYKLAEANGLGANAGLIEGQRLSVPAGVMKNTHNASTFNPYDPSEVIGDVGPAPTPAAKKNKCGVFGQILIAVVAVAISVALPELAPGVFGATGALGAVGGAVAASVIGNVASQAVGLATGIQDKFDWKGVAIAGISAGVGAGVGQALGQAGVLGSKVLTDLARGVLGSAITQGIGVATGLQSKFDWAGVAASGIGAAAGGIAGRSLPGRALPAMHGFDAVPATFGNLAGASAADLLTSAAARSLVEGTSFGDNVLAQLPSAIANTIGGVIANALARQPTSPTEANGDGNTTDTEAHNTTSSNGEDIIVTESHHPNIFDELGAGPVGPNGLSTTQDYDLTRRAEQYRRDVEVGGVLYARDRMRTQIKEELRSQYLADHPSDPQSSQSFHQIDMIDGRPGQIPQVVPPSISSLEVNDWAARLVASHNSRAMDTNVFNKSMDGIRENQRLNVIWDAAADAKEAELMDFLSTPARTAFNMAFEAPNIIYSGYQLATDQIDGVDFAAGLIGMRGAPLSGMRQLEHAAERISGPIAGGGARLENLSSGEILRIQNAADRTGTQVTVVGSRANGTARANSDWDFILPEGTPRSTRHSLTSSLPEGPRGLGEPRNQDFFLDLLDPSKPHIIFTPRPRTP